MNESCPVDHRLLEVTDDPYAYYESLRQGCPVSPSPVGQLVTRRADVLTVAGDPHIFSSKSRADSRTKWGDTPTPEMEKVVARGYPEVDVTITADPPEHQRYRKYASEAFRPARIRQIGDDLTDLVTDLVDSFIDDGQVDFVRQFAVPFPLLVIAGFLGVDKDKLDDLERWSDHSLAPLAGNLTDEERLVCLESRVEAQHYMMDLIRERAKNPKDDLLTDLVQAGGDELLHENEVLSLALGILVAGNESTRATLSNGMAVLADRPDLQERLRREPAKIKDFVEEILRFDAPVQMSFRRAAKDVEIEGAALEKDSRIAVVWASANRDASFYENPDDFDIDRTNRRHLAFGHGEHLCLGSALARAELQTAFEILLTRMENWRLAPDEQPARTTGVTFHGFRRLPLLFDKVQ